jgi:hypothetical protein
MEEHTGCESILEIHVASSESSAKSMVLGPCGVHTPDNLDFVSKLVAYLQDRDIGWTAWSWSDDPLLVNRYVPTKYGLLVSQQLTTP